MAVVAQYNNMSLKSQLVQEIESRKGEIFTYEDLVNYCWRFKVKVETASRRLHDSESPQIEKVRNKKKVVIGYRVKGKQGKLF